MGTTKSKTVKLTVEIDVEWEIGLTEPRNADIADDIQKWLNGGYTREDLTGYGITCPSGEVRVLEATETPDGVPKIELSPPRNDFEPDPAKRCGYEWDGQGGAATCHLTKGHPKLRPGEGDCHEMMNEDGRVYEWIPVEDTQ